MSALLSLFGSSAFGALFGSLFAWLNRREERAEQALKFQHDEKMAELQTQKELSLADKKMEAVRVEGEQVVAAKEVDAFTASQASAFMPTSSHLIEVVRGAMRPLITMYILTVATYFAYNVSGLVGGMQALNTAALFELYATIINEIFFLANLCVSWWFGARGSSRKALVLKPASTPST